jgi:hypothetical protein
MDTAQILLTIVIVLLALILVALAVQVFFILREFRRTINKANKILDDTGIITESISNPLSNLSNLTSGLKIGALIAKFLTGKKKHHEGEKEEE